MKTFNLIFLALLFVVGFCSISCFQESAGSLRSDVPYFQFDASDYDRLLEVYEVEEEFVSFRNQSDEIIRFKVNSSTIGREQKVSGGSFFGASGGSLIYFFDAQRIRLELTEFPDYSYHSEFLIQKTTENKLRASIDFPLWNDNTGSGSTLPNTILLNFNETPMTITFNNVTYNQVYEIVSESNEPLNPLGPYQRNINVLYYDIKEGIVGFNDLDGGQWRLVN